MPKVSKTVGTALLSLPLMTIQDKPD